MPLTMYDASVGTFRLQFEALRKILAKAEAHAVQKGYEPGLLLQARLYVDMFPLVRQVQIACDVAKAGAARLAGLEPPSHPDDETTFGQLHARIDKVLAFIDTIPRASIDGSEGRAITVPTRERTFEFLGQAYLIRWVLPNFYFHVTTAYDILRQCGVDLGKKDFLGGG